MPHGPIVYRSPMFLHPFSESFLFLWVCPIFWDSNAYIDQAMILDIATDLPLPVRGLYLISQAFGDQGELLCKVLPPWLLLFQQRKCLPVAFGSLQRHKCAERLDHLLSKHLSEGFVIPPFIGIAPLSTATVKHRFSICSEKLGLSSQLWEHICGLWIKTIWLRTRLDWTHNKLNMMHASSIAPNDSEFLDHNSLLFLSPFSFLHCLLDLFSLMILSKPTMLLGLFPYIVIFLPT